MCPWCGCIWCMPMHICVWPDPPSPPTVFLHPVPMPCAILTRPCPLPPVHPASQPPFAWPSPLSHISAPIRTSRAPPTCSTLLPCVLGPTLTSWAPCARTGPLSRLPLSRPPFPAPTDTPRPPLMRPGPQQHTPALTDVPHRHHVTAFVSRSCATGWHTRIGRAWETVHTQ